MKLKKLLFIGLTSLLFLGCGDDTPKPEKEEVKLTKEETKQDKIQEVKESQDDVPYWIEDPTSLDNLSALGKALKTTGGSRFQQTEAVAGARDDLRKIIKDKVSNGVLKSFEKFLKEIDKDDDFEKNQLVEVAEKVGTHVSLQVISGTKKKAIWFDKKENFYVLVSIDSKIVKELAYDGIRMILRTHKDLYSIFREKNGRKFLKEELEKTIYN
ncbi:MAG: LPP20 family lipoprotein [Campylobacterales bacterium]|nr:LPP20 family lipoprotein [Campylobacterales bacterium]